MSHINRTKRGVTSKKDKGSSGKSKTNETLKVKNKTTDKSAKN